MTHHAQLFGFFLTERVLRVPPHFYLYLIGETCLLCGQSLPCGAQGSPQTYACCACVVSKVKEQRIFRLLAVSRASLTLQDALWLTGEIVRRQSDPEGGNLQGLGDARWFYKTPPQLPMMGRLPTRQRV